MTDDRGRVALKRASVRQTCGGTDGPCGPPPGKGVCERVREESGAGYFWVWFCWRTVMMLTRVAVMIWRTRRTVFSVLLFM